MFIPGKWPLKNIQKKPVFKTGHVLRHTVQCRLLSSQNNFSVHYHTGPEDEHPGIDATNEEAQALGE